jgi:UDP-glucose 4-epimerase
MRCLITGAAGLIGSHLAEELPDVVPALPRLIAADQAGGRAVNLGSTEQISIEDLERRVPDCTLAADLVGFAATRNLDEIIRAVAAEQSSARQAAA